MNIDYLKKCIVEAMRSDATAGDKFDILVKTVRELANGDEALLNLLKQASEPGCEIVAAEKLTFLVSGLRERLHTMQSVGS